MKLKLTWLLTLFMAFVMQFSFAQEKTVTGTVTTASDGLPLPGANVIVKGTSNGQQTDFDGKFSIKVNQGDILVVSYVGMQTQEVTVGTSNTYNVSLKEDNALEEVVVIGRITQTREKSNVSSVKLSEKSIKNRPNPSVVQTLNGQVAGVNITTNTGQPGANSTIQIRGIGSINGDTEPLFVIDGVPVDQDNFRSINPQEIASVEVLKDAGATAIYGNRGANGVIVLTTKRGNFEQDLQVNYNGFLAYSTLQDNDYNVMSSQELLRYERFRGQGAGAGNSTSVFNPGNGSPMTDAQIAEAPNFDWSEFFFRTGVTQNHTIQLSSGSKNFSQFTSFGYNDTQGILQDSDLQRFNVRNNLSGKSSNGKFTYNTNLSVNYSKSNEPNAIGTSGINRNFIIGAFESVPYVTAADYTTGGDLLSPLSFTNTPLFLLDRLRTYTRFEEEVKIVGGLNMGYEITDWLSANVTMGGDYNNNILTRAEGPTSFNALLFGGAENPTSGFQEQRSTRAFTYNQITSLNASKAFGKHTVGAAVYTEYFKAHFRQFGYFANGLNPSTFSPGDGSGLVQQAGGLFNDEADAEILNAGLFSVFGTVDYDFDTRYGFSASLRRDASSRFRDENQWGTFWSVSGRWNISNEAFMQGSIFNNLKLRASYGETGNQFITGTLFGGLDNTEDFFTSTGGYGNANSLALAQIGVSDLRWETITQTNIGIDFGLWNDRLRGNFDWYVKETSDLYQEGPVSATAGITSLDINTGTLFNRGIDYSVFYDVFTPKTENGFLMTVGFLGNYNETELQDLPNAEGEIISGGEFSAGLGRNGGQLYEYYGLRYVGVNPANGELLYLTADGNVTEQPSVGEDRVWLGKNAIPEWTGTFQLDLEFKGFFLTNQWAFATGVDRIDNDYASLVNPDDVGQFNLSRDILRAWSQPGDITDQPSPTAANRNSFASDRFMRSADFLRLRFASFGYRFPKSVLDGTGFTNVSVFVNAENAITFTEWRGYDPETRSITNAGGTTLRGYPTPKTFSFGVELGF
ncbi:SusC/RagA family TonB-linked outer membrane protein [Winogradskyella aurantia]|uniref:SusC/RagA family TonB-linked outer membrane protein n=1 Tax=Winogradskyella aurantia TaxID=1915063 RepID=A0A265UP58_9FLAO|nr:SusC/RagA family TonB-linked outer membrane protein [Winogradskyella aurantia]OZV67113.1 SusC/RagA family TonB-linked outer membrane protein [Winogradskyella aurantia]